MALSEDGQDIDRGVGVNGRGAFGDVVVGGHGASLARMVGGEIPSDNSWVTSRRAWRRRRMRRLRRGPQRRRLRWFLL